MIRAGVEAILSSLPDLVVVVVNIAVTRYEINVGVTIPHSMVLGSHLANDSTSAGERGLTLHTSVTIGYDVPRRKVHEPLIAAARATEHLKAKPEPFVLQTAPNDFYVSDELNADTGQPTRMAEVSSERHRHSQDKFNEAGVEIMSPHAAQLRDGNRTTIPAEDVTEGDEPPAHPVTHVEGPDPALRAEARADAPGRREP